MSQRYWMVWPNWFPMNPTRISWRPSTPIGALDGKSRSWMGIFPLPFAHDRDVGYIVDADGHPVLEIRGYGKISQLIYEAKANTVQDEFSQLVVHTLNGTTTGELNEQLGCNR